jgi:hypothetical protein
LAQRIARLIADINGAISTGLGQNPSARPPTRDPDRGQPTTDGANSRRTTSSGDAAVPVAGVGEGRIILNQTNIIQGTPVNQRRAMGTAAGAAMDAAARRTR